MKYHKLTFGGPQTSMSIAGRHFPKGQPVYMEDHELPFSVYKLRSLGIKCEIVDADEKPAAPVVSAGVGGAVGMVWQGQSPRKATDWGSFAKGVARFDLPAAAIAYLSTQSGWKRVSR